MKTGDTIDVRPVGSTGWVKCRVDLASGNGKSLALSAEEGLPLLALDLKTGRQVLLLLKDDDGFCCVHTGRRYEVREEVTA